MRPRLRTSLRGRLILWVAAVGAILVLTASGGASLVLQRQFEGAVDEGLSERASDVAAAWVPGGTAELADPFAQVLARNGEVLAHSASAPDQPIIDPQDLVGLSRSGLWLNTSVPQLRGPARVFARPAHGAVVVVAAPLEALDSARKRLQHETWGLLGLLLVALLAITWLLVGAALRPVGRMTQAADRMLEGPTRSGVLPVPTGDDELSRLAGTLNRLLDALAGVIARERSLVDDASHELRTPLSTLRGELELTLDEPDPLLQRQGVERALAEAQRLSVLADDLLVLARETGGTGRPRSAIALLPWLADAVRGVLPPAVRVTVHGEPVQISADPLALDRVVSNILRNAAAAGAVTVDVSVAERDGTAVVRFVDDGAGLAPDSAAHAFERFYRAEPARPQAQLPMGTSGAGLGLSIVKAVVEAHGGTATIRNADPAHDGRSGAVVELRLPAVPAVPAPTGADSGRDLSLRQVPHRGS